MRIPRLWLRMPMLVLILAGLPACATTPASSETPAARPTLDGIMEVSPRWERDLGSPPDFVAPRAQQPAVGQGLIVASSGGSDLSAFAFDGAPLWTIEVPGRLISGPGVGDELVAVATQDAEVLALDRHNGSLRWRARTATEVLAPPATQGAQVIVQSADGQIQARSSTSGEPVWSLKRDEPPLALRGTAAPVTDGKIVMIGFARGRIAAVNAADGHLLWEQAVSEGKGRNEVERLSDVDASPLVMGARVFAVAYQGRLVAFDHASGRPLWARDLSSWLDLAGDVHHVYVTDSAGVVTAFDGASGATVWRQESLRARGVSAPGVHHGRVVVGDYEGFVYWLDPADGHLVAWSRPGDNPIRHIVVREMLAVTADSAGRIAAFLAPALKTAASPESPQLP